MDALTSPTMVMHTLSLRILVADFLGHAGAMLQARQLGSELLVGVHSDEAILENKGPTVMRLDERCVQTRGHTISIMNTP
jgi:phosphopantetheine adenylyltransferase